MNRLILPIILLVLVIASTAQAVTVTGVNYPDLVSAEITPEYSGDTLTLTVENTSSDASVLTALLFSIPETVTLTLESATYYAPGSTTGTDATSDWALSEPRTANILNAEPMSWYDGLNTTLLTGPNFNGGTPNNGISPSWTAVFLFSVEGTISDTLDVFIARFQRSDLDGGDSDFAHPTPLPSALLLLGSGLVGLMAVRRRF